MISAVGRGALLAAALNCVLAVALSLTGARGRPGRVEAGRRALTAAAGLLAVALVALAWALLTGDYSLEYVARATSRSMSWPYRLGSLWSGMEGSLLLWCWLLAMTAALGAGHLRRTKRATSVSGGPVPDATAAVGGASGSSSREASATVGPTAELEGGVQAVLGVLVGGAVLVLLGLADPFARLAAPALDGAGLTPILEHPALLYHPPILYLGQTLLAVPFAATIAALLRGELDGAWLAVARRFALLAWVALSVGMVAGAHWAYRELGWGGYWAWDPVENASLMPWLATTAFIHAALVVERRKRLRAWTAGLAVSAFAVALVGAYLTRSGVTGSVHAFAEARAIGIAFLVGVAAVVLAGGLLLARHRRRLGDGWAPDGLATREAALLANNAVLVAGLVVVTAGTLAPVVSDALGGAKFVVAPGFFSSLVAVPALIALALAGLGPALPWSASGRRRTLAIAGLGAGLGLAGVVVFDLARAVMLPAALAGGSTVALSVRQAWRDRRRARRLAAAVGHLGLALALLGIAGSTQGAETSGPLGPEEQLTLGRYRLVHEGLIQRTTERRSSARVQLGLFIGKNRVGTLRPGLDTYSGPGGSGAPLPETALRSTPREDLLVTVTRIDVDRGVVVVEVFRRPLVAWIWIGGILLAAGGALALRRPRRRHDEPETHRATATAVAG
jgi:cytochrome c-type biogenesis protein CcmF